MANAAIPSKRFRVRIRAFIFFFLFLSLALPAMPVSGSDCPPLVTKGEIDAFCARLAGVQRREVVQTAEEIKSKIEKRATLGIRRIPRGEKRCHKLVGWQLTLFSEDAEGVLLDRFFSNGETDGDGPVTVLASQRGKRESVSERFTEVSLQLFWRESDISSIRLQAGLKQVPRGGSTSVKAELRCGPCPVEGETVRFSCGSGGGLAPEETVSDATGVAATRLTLKREEPVTVTARSGEKRASATIQPVWTPWTADISIKVDDTYYDEQGRQVYVTHADYKVRVVNLLLAKMVFNARGLEKSKELGACPLHFLPLNNPFESSGQGHLKGMEKRLYCDKNGYCHWEKTNFDLETPATLLIGILLSGEIPHRKMRKDVFAFGLNVGSAVILKTSHGPVRYNLVPPAPSREESEREFQHVPIIPFDTILDRHPINLGERITRKYENGGRGTWSYTYRFTPEK